MDGIEAGAQVNILGQADKSKLDGISAGAQVNVIEHVSVNGNELTVSNKSVGFYERNMRKNSTLYAVGDIVYSANIPSWLRLECTTAGTTATSEPTMPTAEGLTVTDGTAVFQLRRTISTATLFDNAGAHNALYRGKNLTSYFDSGAMSTAISNGTFNDIYPGDYIVKSVTVDGTTYSNVEWVVGDLDYHLHRGDTENTTHHVLVFPRAHIGNKPMNASNVTAGGFVGSVMWTTTLQLYATGIKAAFGADHVLSHRELLSSAESDTIASGAGAGYNGATTSFSWCDVTVNLFNEPMVYGGRVLSSSLYDVGDCYTQIAAMRHNKSLSFDRSYWYWLRAVASSSSFAIASGYGYANGNAASSSGGGVRPYFLLH